MLLSPVSIIYNPVSGHDQSEKVAQELATFLKAKNALTEIHLMPISRPNEAAKLAKNAVTRYHSKLVVCAGGDGTINEVVSGLVSFPDPPYLGILPTGTINNIAHVFDIPLTKDGAFENLVSGVAKPIDVGQVNEHTYLVSTLTVGIMADIAIEVSRHEKQRFGPFAYLFKGIKALARHQHYHIRVSSEGKQWDKDTQLILITMTNSVGGFTNFDPEAKPNDGMFHVFLAPKLSLLNSLRAIPYFLTGNFKKLPGMTYFQVPELQMTVQKNAKKVRTRIDGDPSVDLPLQMKVLKNAVHIIAPNENN